MKVMTKATYAGKHRASSAFLERDVMLVARHPFLVRLRFAFQSRESLYLVTDYYDGGSLEDSLRAAPGRRGLGLDAARHVIAQLSLGLDYLHARDVLHRDIKAANVLLDADGHAHLCDFGLAKCVDEANRAADGAKRSFAGTVEYMAPELLRRGGEAPTPALDWWALGILLVETVSGKTPFRASTPRRLMLNIVREPPQLGEPGAEPDDEYAAAAHKLLRKDPAARLRSVLALSRRRFFAAVDFSTLAEKRTRPPFAPRATSFAFRENPALAAEFGPGDAARADNARAGSITFKGGEEFAGFSVFASPARAKARKKAPYFTPQVLPPTSTSPEEIWSPPNTRSPPPPPRDPR